MLKLLISSLFLFFSFACSQADHQSVGAKIPPPGSQHLLQVHVIADSENPGPLVLNFLSQNKSVFLDSKIYVERPKNTESAESVLREWSARSLDWLIVAGAVSEAAFLKTKISWVGAKNILILSSSFQVKKDSADGAENIFTLFDNPEKFNIWSADICKNKSPTLRFCPPNKERSLFFWSHESSDSSHVKISWNWNSFFKSLQPKTNHWFEVSFDDGFLTLDLVNAEQLSDVEKSHLRAWIVSLAMKGLSGK